MVKKKHPITFIRAMTACLSMLTRLQARQLRNHSSTPGRSKKFSCPLNCQTFSGSTQPPTHWMPRVLSKHKVDRWDPDNSPPSITNIKNKCSYTCTPHYTFMIYTGSTDLYLFLIFIRYYTKNCDIRHLLDQRVARCNNSINIKTLYLMCILLYLATPQTN